MDNIACSVLVTFLQVKLFNIFLFQYIPSDVMLLKTTTDFDFYICLLFFMPLLASSTIASLENFDSSNCMFLEYHGFLYMALYKYKTCFQRNLMLSTLKADKPTLAASSWLLSTVCYTFFAIKKSKPTLIATKYERTYFTFKGLYSPLIMRAFWLLIRK